MPKQTPDVVWVGVELIATNSQKTAWLVDNGKQRAWLPTLAISDSEEDLAVGLHTKIEIRRAMAEEKGLV